MNKKLIVIVLVLLTFVLAGAVNVQQGGWCSQTFPTGSNFSSLSATVTCDRTTITLQDFNITMPVFGDGFLFRNTTTIVFNDTSNRNKSGIVQTQSGMTTVFRDTVITTSNASQGWLFSMGSNFAAPLTFDNVTIYRWVSFSQQSDNGGYNPFLINNSQLADVGDNLMQPNGRTNMSYLNSNATALCRFMTAFDSDQIEFYNFNITAKSQCGAFLTDNAGSAVQRVINKTVIKGFTYCLYMTADYGTNPKKLWVDSMNCSDTSNVGINAVGLNNVTIDHYYASRIGAQVINAQNSQNWNVFNSISDGGYGMELYQLKNVNVTNATFRGTNVINGNAGGLDFDQTNDSYAYNITGTNINRSVVTLSEGDNVTIIGITGFEPGGGSYSSFQSCLEMTGRNYYVSDIICDGFEMGSKDYSSGPSANVIVKPNGNNRVERMKIYNLTFYGYFEAAGVYGGAHGRFGGLVNDTVNVSYRDVYVRNMKGITGSNIGVALLWEEGYQANFSNFEMGNLTGGAWLRNDTYPNTRLYNWTFWPNLTSYQVRVSSNSTPTLIVLPSSNFNSSQVTVESISALHVGIIAKLNLTRQGSPLANAKWNLSLSDDNLSRGFADYFLYQNGSVDANGLANLTEIPYLKINNTDTYNLTAKLSVDYGTTRDTINFSAATTDLSTDYLSLSLSSAASCEGISPTSGADWYVTANTNCSNGNIDLGSSPGLIHLSTGVNLTLNNVTMTGMGWDANTSASINFIGNTSYVRSNQSAFMSVQWGSSFKSYARGPATTRITLEGLPQNSLDVSTGELDWDNVIIDTFKGPVITPNDGSVVLSHVIFTNYVSGSPYVKHFGSGKMIMDNVEMRGNSSVSGVDGFLTNGGAYAIVIKNSYFDNLTDAAIWMNAATASLQAPANISNVTMRKTVYPVYLNVNTNKTQIWDMYSEPTYGGDGIHGEQAKYITIYNYVQVGGSRGPYFYRSDNINVHDANVTNVSDCCHGAIIYDQTNHSNATRIISVTNNRTGFQTSEGQDNTARDWIITCDPIANSNPSASSDRCHGLTFDAPGNAAFNVQANVTSNCVEAFDAITPIWWLNPRNITLSNMTCTNLLAGWEGLSIDNATEWRVDNFKTVNSRVNSTSTSSAISAQNATNMNFTETILRGNYTYGIRTYTSGGLVFVNTSFVDVAGTSNFTFQVRQESNTFLWLINTTGLNLSKFSFDNSNAYSLIGKQQRMAVTYYNGTGVNGAVIGLNNSACKATLPYVNGTTGADGNSTTFITTSQYKINKTALYNCETWTATVSVNGFTNTTTFNVTQKGLMVLTIPSSTPASLTNLTVGLYSAFSNLSINLVAFSTLAVKISNSTNVFNFTSVDGNLTTSNAQITFGMYNITVYDTTGLYYYNNQTAQVNYTSTNYSYNFSLFGAIIRVNASTIISKQALVFNVSMNSLGFERGEFNVNSTTFYTRKDGSAFLQFNSSGYYPIGPLFVWETLPLGSNVLNNSYTANFSNDLINVSLFDSVTGRNVSANMNLSFNNSAYVLFMQANSNPGVFWEQGLDIGVDINASGYYEYVNTFTGNATYQTLVLYLTPILPNLTDVILGNYTPHSFNISGNATMIPGLSIRLNSTACYNSYYSNTSYDSYFVFNCSTQLRYNATFRPSFSVLLNASGSYSFNYSLVIDNDAPNNMVTTPDFYGITDGQTFTTRTISLRYNSSDADNDTPTFTLFLNNTILTSSNLTSYVFSPTLNGSQNLTVQATDGFDTLANVNSSITIYVNLNLPTQPVIETPNNNSVFNETSVLVSYNSSHADNLTITYYVFGANSPTNQTIIYNSTSTSYNWSGLRNGTYYVIVMAGDGSGNSTNSTTTTFTVYTGQNNSLTIRFKDAWQGLIMPSITFSLSNQTTGGLQLIGTTSTLPTGSYTASLANGTYNVSGLSDTQSFSDSLYNSVSLTTNTELNVTLTGLVLNVTAKKIVTRTPVSFNFTLSTNNYKTISTNYGLKNRTYNGYSNYTIYALAGNSYNLSANLSYGVSYTLNDSIATTLSSTSLNGSYSYTFNVSDNNITVILREYGTNASINNFNITLLQNSYGFIATSNTSNGNTSVLAEQGITYTLLVEAQNYGHYNTLITGNASQQNITLYLIGSNFSSMVINIFDEDSGLPLSQVAPAGTVANLEFISPQYATNWSTTNTLVITNIPPGGYEIRYTATGYQPRNYYLELPDGVIQTLNLYLLNSSRSTFIQTNVQDLTGLPVKNATIKALRYYLSLNSYVTVAMVRTDATGNSNIDLVKNTVWYEFLIDYQNRTVSQTDKSLISSSINFLQFRVGLTDDIFAGFAALPSVGSGITFNNVTKTVAYTWDDQNNIVTYGRLVVQRNDLYAGPQTICDTTTNGASGTILCGVGNTSSDYYALGYVHTNTTFNLYQIAQKAIVNTWDFKLWQFNSVIGGILSVMIVLTMALLFRGNLAFMIIGSLAGLGVGIMFGLFTLGPALTGFVTLCIAGFIIILKSER